MSSSTALAAEGGSCTALAKEGGSCTALAAEGGLCTAFSAEGGPEERQKEDKRRENPNHTLKF